jgi:PhnB protein
MAKKTKKPVSKKIVKKSAKKNTKKVAAKSKKKKVLAIPKGYNCITPYLMVHNAKEAIDFYKNAFGAKEALRLNKPDGKIAHAELKIGDTKIMLADCHHYTHDGNGSAVSIHLYVKDVDTVTKAATKGGAKLLRSVTEMFYGDRAATIEDPYGHKWTVATHIEDMTPAQLKKRAMEFFNEK